MPSHWSKHSRKLLAVPPLPCKPSTRSGDDDNDPVDASAASAADLAVADEEKDDDDADGDDDCGGMMCPGNGPAL